MTFILSILSSSGYYYFFNSTYGWITWLATSSWVAYSAYRWQSKQAKWNGRQWTSLAGLVIITLIFSTSLGIFIPSGNTPFSATATNPQTGAMLMLLAAIPWMLAAGILGPTASTALAAISGLIIGYWGSHNLFTPLELAVLGLVFGLALKQNYRTKTFGFLRRPFVAAFLLAIAYPILFSLLNIISFGDSLLQGIEVVTANLGLAFATTAGQLLFAGFITETILITWPSIWSDNKNQVPSPVETSLENRFLYLLIPVISIMFLSLIVAVWAVVGNTAEALIKDQLSSAVAVAAESMPFVLESGQNIITDIAKDERIINYENADLSFVLQENLRAIPYFHQLNIFDIQGQPVSGYPNPNYADINPTREEQAGIKLALRGVPILIYSIPPSPGGTSGQLSFIATIKDGDGIIQGVLVGRSGLELNPFSEPIISELSRLESMQGYGILIDPNGVIIHHPNPELIMTNYTGIINKTATFNQELSYAGNRNITFNQPVAGHGWVVVGSVPVSQIQQQAINIASPLIGILFTLGVITFVVMRVGLRTITKSLKGLARQSSRIAAGELDQAIPSQRSDELGKLGAAFEDMRLSLKTRLEEANSLLLVSMGVSSSLEMNASITPILEAAVSNGIVSARLVLTSTITKDFDQKIPSRFGIGPDTDIYASLDSSILKLNIQQEMVTLTHPARAGLDLPDKNTQPGSIIAIALKHEGVLYGSLWVAHREYHKFSEEVIRFIKSLAIQATLAITNSRLYFNANVGRQQLEAILASTSDPLIVTDFQDNLLLANPAAMNLMEATRNPSPGMPIKDVISQVDLVSLLVNPEKTSSTDEIEFPNGLIYFATASPVIIDEQVMGRVCVLHDITHLKELDKLKSDFVNTVSLDLRAPLKALRGHAGMLEAAGNLNTQQEAFLGKILAGVTGMTEMVNNLLDLGRIEAGVDLKLEKVQMIEVVNHAVESLRSRAEQKSIPITINGPATATPLIEGDKTLLQKAVYNLIENAIKFTDREGKINIEITLNQDGILVTVEDTGIGITSIDQARVYERFFRVDSLSDQNSEAGSGLGLSIVKSIAEKHGGHITMESQLGLGSAFHLTIPYRQ